MRSPVQCGWQPSRGNLPSRCWLSTTGIAFKNCFSQFFRRAQMQRVSAFPLRAATSHSMSGLRIFPRSTAECGAGWIFLLAQRVPKGTSRGHVHRWRATRSHCLQFIWNFEQRWKNTKNKRGTLVLSKSAWHKKHFNFFCVLSFFLQVFTNNICRYKFKYRSYLHEKI